MHGAFGILQRQQVAVGAKRRWSKLTRGDSMGKLLQRGSSTGSIGHLSRGSSGKSWKASEAPAAAPPPPSPPPLARATEIDKANGSLPD